MSAVAYLGGSGALAVALLALAYGSRHLRRLVVPAWSGALAGVAEVVLGLSMLTVVLELTGLVGQLRPGVVMVAVPLVAVAAGLIARRRARPAPPPPDPPAGPRWEVIAGFVLAAVVFAQWLAHAGVIMEGGLRDMDSLRYHGPFAARWVQQHSLIHLQHTSSEVQETFFPANAELLHAYGILLFGRDVLTPVLNLGWYGFGVLVAWAAPISARGRAAAVAGFAALCSTPLIASIEPGSAKNDLAAAVLVIGLAAFLLHRGDDDRGPLLLAGLAAGLAVGTKLTVLVPVLVLVLGAVWLTPARRGRAVATLLGAATLTGSFWYLRNLVHTGNPLPWLQHLGPISLPAPAMPGPAAHGFSVLHYATDGSFWAHVVPDGLHRSFGPLFPVLLGGAAGLALLSLVGRRVPAPARLVAGAALAGMA
ncbi:MAG: hypothetical protein JWO68_2093, partial [Actinomycetia bacterium]|nr:hypothetical protein [Actinomycetes bacterium]